MVNNAETFVPTASIINIVKPKIEVISSVDPIVIMKTLENIARGCYKSEDKITDTSYSSFINGIIARGHEAMLEHASITVKFTTDRGVSHELVRHRIASFAQTSTRYCNYSNDRFGSAISVIQPFYFDPEEERKDISFDGHYDLQAILGEQTFSMNSFDVWFLSCLVSNWAYMQLTTTFNRKPEEARTVLPNSLMTEIYITANLREWRHILNLRAIGTTGKPHPDMQRMMLQVLQELYDIFPVIFNDIHKEAAKRAILGDKI